MALNSRKDEKIQIYWTDEKEVEGTTVVKKFRHFIYSRRLFRDGVLWANVRSLKQSEIVANGLSMDKVNIQVTVNRNPYIDSTQKIIYRNNVYDIKTPPDELDFRSNEIKFIATKTTDTIKYAGDIFDE